MYNIQYLLIIILLGIIIFLIYRLFSYNADKIDKLKENINENINIEFDDINEKLCNIEELIEKKFNDSNKKIKELYSLQNKMNEVNIMNNQSILNQINQYDENVENIVENIDENKNHIFNSAENSSINKQNLNKDFFIKIHPNDKENFYMSSHSNNNNLNSNKISQNNIFTYTDITSNEYTKSSLKLPNSKSNSKSNTESNSESNSESETKLKQVKIKLNQKINQELNKKSVNNKFGIVNSEIELKSELEVKAESNKKLDRVIFKEKISNKKLLDKIPQFENKNKIKLNNLNNNKSNSTVTLYADKVEIIIGGKILINESDLAINSGTKYFVLGQNGIGKTSLLKSINLKLQNKLDILMIDQDIEINLEENQKISEFILDADIILNETRKRVIILENKNNLDEKELDEYNKLSEIMYQKEWDKYEAESKKIINGLGFLNAETKVNILSGGKRMLLAIGKALLRKPDILILDEPTNHLDLNVVIWLKNYLESYKKTLIIITHQIGLVNSLADIIWYIGNPELTGNKVYTIRGNYYNLLKYLEQTEKEKNKEYEKFIKKVEELRKKSTPKKEVDEFILKKGINRPPKSYNVNITFSNVIELSTKNIIELRNVDFSYLDSEKIYLNLSINLSMGSRIILVGSNGSGKTTFFKLVSGKIKPTSGLIISDDRLRIGYYNQQILDNLPIELTPIEYLQKLDSNLDNNHCRSILGKLGIKKQDQIDLPTNKIKNLSGGQKARVSLCSVQMINPHLILLDEPTNHLDLESIEGLIKGINSFNGGIVIITHDMYLIESIKNADIYQVISQDIKKFNGDFEEYCKYVNK